MLHHLLSLNRVLLVSLVALLTGCHTFTNKPQLSDCHITCYITEASQPGASLQLVVKAGSLQEQDHEQGFAHFVEHIAFNDTRDYTQEQLFARLRALGMEPGKHSNGMTHFDHTHYTLFLNDAKEENLDAALHILAQWAYHVQFDQAVIDAEKPVIKEEWRLEPDPKNSAARQQLKHLLKGSRYAQRYPIGQPEVFMNARAEDLQAFYQRWYRPDNFAVIVTGQVDKDRVIKQINRHFPPTDGTTNTTDLAAKSYPVSTKHYPRAHVINSTDISKHKLILNYFVDIPLPSTPEAVLQTIRIQAVHQILNNRLQKRLEDTVGILTDFSVNWLTIGPDSASTTIEATLSDTDIEAATRVISEEINYLLVEGVQTQEWEQWYDEQVQDFDRSMHLGKMILEPKAHFLYQTPILSPADRKALFDRYESQIRPEGLDKMAQQLFQHKPHWELLSSQPHPVPDQQQLTQWLQGNTHLVDLKRSTTDHSDTRNLWQIHPETTPRLQDSQTIAEHTRQWQFTNGMTVLHRYNGNVPGQFAFSLTGKNGLNLFTDDQLPQARSAMNILSTSGMRTMSAIELDQWLKTRKISLQAEMNFFSRELWGYGRTEDFAEIMQLLHVILTETEASEEAIARYQSQKLREYQQQHSTPHHVLQRYLDEALFNNHPALKAMTTEDIEPLNPADQNQIYRDLLRGAQNYQLAIVGDIEALSAYPKVFRYIASIPKAEQQHPIKQTYPLPEKPEIIDLTGNLSKSTLLEHRLSIPKTQLPYHYDQVIFMAYWVRQHLMQRLREEYGMTYDVQVLLEGFEALRPDMTLDISLNCDPEQVNTVRKALKSALEQMSSTPPTPSDIQLWQKARHGELTYSLKNPMIQAAGLTRAQLADYTPSQILDVQTRTQPPAAADLVNMITLFTGAESIQQEVVWRARK